MKNLSISKKLIIGFGTILVMILITIGMSFYSISGISEQINSYSKYTLPNSTSIWMIRRNTVSVQRDIASALMEIDTKKITKWMDTASEDSETLLSEIDAYAGNQRDTSRDDDIAKIREMFNSAAKIRLEIAAVMKTPTESNMKLAKEKFENEYVPIMNQVTEILVKFTTTADERALIQEKDASASVQFAFIILTLCGVTAVILSIILAIIIRKSILTPVNEIVDAYDEIAKGNMKKEIKYESRDELSKMAALIQKTNMMQSVILADVIDKFTKISHGDLRLKVDLEYPGDYIVLKETIEDTVFTLNNTMLNINMAA